jgi:dephospho-CoA kinase
MPFVVGLTGGISSGKSTVAKLFAEHGVPTINADQIARDLVQPDSVALTRIADQFGQDILTAEGELDRAKLRSLVFANADRRLWLENLLHPMITAERNRRIAAMTAPYVIVEIPLLLEKGLQGEVNRVLAVDLPETLQIDRASARDGATEASVLAIMATQVSAGQRRLQADDLIDNSGDLDQLRAQVEGLHSRYLKLAAQAD